MDNVLCLTKFVFGKYKNENAKYVLENDPAYIKWCYHNGIVKSEFFKKIYLISTQMKEPESSSSWRSKYKISDIAKKSNDKCWYCGTDNPFIDYSIDHQDPFSKSKNNNIDNLVYCCRSCNCTKHTKNVEEFRKWLILNKFTIKNVYWKFYGESL